MPTRYTLVSWSCPYGHINEGISRHCLECGYDRIEKHAQCHASERAVVFRHPVTGEIRRPMRADAPMHPKFAAAGFEREEITSMIAHEKETGSAHEATNWAPGNEPSPIERYPDKKAPKEVIHRLIDDIRAANQSGPWTLDTPLGESGGRE